MGHTNLRLALENLHAVLGVELRDVQREFDSCVKAAERVDELQWKRFQLQEDVKAAERLLKRDDPEWRPTLVAPRKKRKWTSLFKPGDRIRIALTILRENGGWMRPYAIACIMLDQIRHDPEDRIERQRLANSLSNSFKKHEGDLVESRGDFAKEWRVIR